MTTRHYAGISLRHNTIDNPDGHVRSGKLENAISSSSIGDFEDACPLSNSSGSKVNLEEVSY